MTDESQAPAHSANSTPPAASEHSPLGTHHPPVADSPISVILIGHNEEAHVEAVVAAWIAELDQCGNEHEILLVDDGSSDRTASLAESIAARQPAVRWLRHPVRKGIGAALRTGLAAARYPLLFCTTGDDQYQPADLKTLLQWIDKVDLVCGYRPRAGRSWRERFLRSWVRLIFAVRLTDPWCLFVLARRSIFARMPIQSDGPFAPAEILAKANFLGCMMTEVPVQFRRRSDSLPLEPFSQLLAEARLVFSYPDFGPPMISLQARSPEARG